MMVPVFAMICTAFATLTAVVFCMAMQANASPSTIREIKAWMIGISGASLGALVVAGFLMRAGQPGRAAGVAIAPTAILAIIFLVTALK